MPAFVDVSDPTGNRVAGHAWLAPATDLLGFNGLPTDAGAWKLGFQLSPPYPTRRAPDYEWTLRAALATKGRVRPAVFAESRGHQLRLGGVDALLSEESHRGEAVRMLRVTVGLAPPKDGCLIALADAYGRPAGGLFRYAGLALTGDPPGELAQFAPGGRHWWGTFSIPYRWRAGSIDLRFVGYRGRAVECVVRP